MSPARLNVGHLITRYGVGETARRLGVDTRTVRRWKNEDVDPSPLAREKIKQLHQTLQGDGKPQDGNSSDTSGPKRQSAAPVAEPPQNAGVVPTRRVGRVGATS